MKIWLTLLLVASLASCKLKDEVVNPDQSKRSYYLGFTTFSFDSSIAAQEYTYGKIKTDADLISFQFNDGVPWEESLYNLSYHNNIINDWQNKKAQIPTGHKVLISVTPINSSYSDIALSKRETGNMPLEIPWDGFKINHPSVRAAYINYCKRIIDYFKPSYFVFADKVNNMILVDPTLNLWNSFLDFQLYVYAELKRIYPSLPIMVSFSVIDLLQGYTSANNQLQLLGLTDALKYSDYFAISLYPFLSNYVADSIPADMFTRIQSLSNKLFCITETGYPAQVTTYKNGTVTLNGTVQKQKDFYEKLFAASENLKPVFICSFLVRDIDKYLQTTNSKDENLKALRDVGLYDENGNARPALELWKNKLNMSYSN